MNFISMDPRQALAELVDASAPVAIRRSVAADLVAALIDYLDETEDDPDLEPSLSGSYGYGYPGDDCEGDPLDTGELDTADDEPSLGAPEPSYALASLYWPPTGAMYGPALPRGSQAGWAAGGRSDFEDEHDGTEPENEHGTELDWGEDDELSREGDDGEQDSGETIPGGGSGRL